MLPYVILKKCKKGICGQNSSQQWWGI